MPADGSFRTCIGCKGKYPQLELLRFVADDCRLLPDPAGYASGRGAYLCAKRACLEQAIARGGFLRAFRRRLERSPERLAASCGRVLGEYIDTRWALMLGDGRIVDASTTQAAVLSWRGQRARFARAGSPHVGSSHVGSHGVEGPGVDEPGWDSSGAGAASGRVEREWKRLARWSGLFGLELRWEK